jgi:hypothetical protein
MPEIVPVDQISELFARGQQWRTSQPTSASPSVIFFQGIFQE